jgi:hypothetical protein
MPNSKIENYSDSNAEFYELDPIRMCHGYECSVPIGEPTTGSNISQIVYCFKE